MKSVIMVLALILSMPNYVEAGRWGSSCSTCNSCANCASCATSAVPQQTQASAQYWKRVPQTINEFALIKDGNQVGNWDATREVYRSYDAKADRWGPIVTAPPVTPPSANGGTIQLMSCNGNCPNQ